MSISRIYRLLRLITMLQSGRAYTADALALDTANGDQVEVLSPVPLRDKVRRIVASMAGIYARGPQS